MAHIRDYTTEDLINELVRRAMDNVNDMTVDFLADPDFVRTEGIPSKEKMCLQAVDFLMQTMPDLISDQSDKQYEREEDKQVGSFEQLLRMIARRTAEKTPALVTLTIKTR